MRSLLLFEPLRLSSPLSSSSCSRMRFHSPVCFSTIDVTLPNVLSLSFKETKMWAVYPTSPAVLLREVRGIAGILQLIRFVASRTLLEMKLSFAHSKVIYYALRNLEGNVLQRGWAKKRRRQLLATDRLCRRNFVRCCFWVSNSADRTLHNNSLKQLCRRVTTSGYRYQFYASYTPSN